MEPSTIQDQTNKLSPDALGATLAHVTHLQAQSLPKVEPQTAHQNAQNAPQAPVAQGDDKEDKALVDTEIEAKIGDLRTEIMDTIKTEIGGVRQAITDALKEESSNDKN